jgi:hypothetical protein
VACSHRFAPRCGAGERQSDIAWADQSAAADADRWANRQIGLPAESKRPALLSACIRHDVGNPLVAAVTVTSIVSSAMTTRRNPLFAIGREVTLGDQNVDAEESYL